MEINLFVLGRSVVALALFCSFGVLSTHNGSSALEKNQYTVRTDNDCIKTELISTSNIMARSIESKELDNVLDEYFKRLEQELKEKSVIQLQKPMDMNKLGILPDDAAIVNVTAYVMGKNTSTGKNVKIGYIAATKELIKRWGYGSKLALYRKTDSGFVMYGTYILEDRMHDNLKNTVDIYMGSYKEAVNFGRQKMWIVKLN